MSSLSVSNQQATEATPAKAKVIQPAWVRALHWINAFAMVLMIMSGWQIYNASPLFNFTLLHRRSRWAAGSAARCSGTLRRCGS